MDLATIISEAAQALVLGAALAWALPQYRQYRQYRQERRARRRQSLRYQLKLTRAATLFAAEALCRLRALEARDGTQLVRFEDSFGGVHYRLVKREPAATFAPLPLALLPTFTGDGPATRAPITRPLPVLVERVGRVQRVESEVTA